MFEWAAWATDDYVVNGATDTVAAPAQRQEYLLTDPDLVQQMSVLNFSAGLSDGPYEWMTLSRRGGSQTWDVFDEPRMPGAPAAPQEVFQAQPGRFDGIAPGHDWDICDLCRQGDMLIPGYEEISGAVPGWGGDASLFIGGSVYGSGLGGVRLYHGGQQIPPDPGFLPFDGYRLPPGPARYRLVLDDAQPWTNVTSHTAWDFTSARVSTQHPGTQCNGVLFGLTDPCQPLPLVLLRYDAGVSLANAVTAPGSHLIQVTAYHAYLDPADTPAITGLKAWTSTDGGATWRPADAITSRGGGAYTVRYTVPPLSATTGTVSLKVQAQDAAGSDVTQTVKDAFKLSTAS